MTLAHIAGKASAVHQAKNDHRVHALTKAAEDRAFPVDPTIEDHRLPTFQLVQQHKEVWGTPSTFEEVQKISDQQDSNTLRDVGVVIMLDQGLTMNDE